MTTENIIKKYKPLHRGDVIRVLPTVETAGIIAVDISEIVNPKLSAQEQSFFVAGFQECVKYMELQGEPIIAVGSAGYEKKRKKVKSRLFTFGILNVEFTKLSFGFSFIFFIYTNKYTPLGKRDLLGFNYSRGREFSISFLFRKYYIFISDEYKKLLKKSLTVPKNE